MYVQTDPLTWLYYSMLSVLNQGPAVEGAAFKMTTQKWIKSTCDFIGKNCLAIFASSECTIVHSKGEYI